jgi:SAM-dependent methyltransferase
MRDDLQESPSRWFATHDGVHLLLPEERRRVLGAFRDMRERAERALGRDMREVMSSDHCFREVWGRLEAVIGAAIGAVLWAGLDAGADRLVEAGLPVAVVDPRRERGDPTLLGLPRAEAELDALPLEPGRFDLVVAAASLHSSPSLPRALVELRRVTRRGGALVAFGSPVFRKASDGEAQVAREMRRERALLGMAVPRETRAGYLVCEDLAEQFRNAGWSLEVLGWPGVLREHGEDLFRLLRGGRRRARYPLLFARRDG